MNDNTISDTKSQLIKLAEKKANKMWPQLGMNATRRLPERKIEGHVVWAISETRKCLSPAWDATTTDEWCKNLINILEGSNG